MDGPQKVTLGSVAVITIAGIAWLGYDLFSPTVRCRERPNAGGTPSAEFVEKCQKICDEGDEATCKALESMIAVRSMASRRDENSEFHGAASSLAFETGRRCSDRAACQESCAAGEAGACLALGLELEFGREDIDPARAREFYAQACRLHEENASCGQPDAVVLPLWEDHVRPRRVRSTYEDEEGTSVLYDTFEPAYCRRPRDKLELAEYAEACAQDCFAAQGCDRFTTLLCTSEREACEQACEGGDAAYCRELYVAYRDGQGVIANPTTAQQYRSKACSLGDEWSCESGKGRASRSIPKALPEPSAAGPKPDTPAVTPG